MADNNGQESSENQMKTPKTLAEPIEDEPIEGEPIEGEPKEDEPIDDEAMDDEAIDNEAIELERNGNHACQNQGIISQLSEQCQSDVTCDVIKDDDREANEANPLTECGTCIESKNTDVTRRTDKPDENSTAGIEDEQESNLSIAGPLPDAGDEDRKEVLIDKTTNSMVVQSCNESERLREKFVNMKETSALAGKTDGINTEESENSSGITPEGQQISSQSSDQRTIGECEAIASTSSAAEVCDTTQEVAKSPTAKLDPSQSLYCLKRFQWKGEYVQIVTQNENGPCPLLAIANVLVLSKRISIPPMQECITGNQLMEYIGDYLLSSRPKNVDDAVILNYQQNMQDAISIMYKLQTGIDVNVRFTGPHEFELTPECLVFDILNIGLYHGWLIDPQDLQMVKSVGNLSYNQLVEKIIRSKDGDMEEEAIEEGLLAESFLDQTASQLTYHGLCELNSEIKEGELCVFFRNNHFSTLYKHKGELFLLVTDQGYLNQSKIIWETLSNVEGDGQFVNENFYTVGPMATPHTYTERTPQTQSDLTQEDRDYLIALSLQEESHARSSISAATQSVNPINTSLQHQEAKDLELARRLQNEENLMAQQQQQVSRHQQSQRQQQPQVQNQISHGQPYHRQHQQQEVHAASRNEKCTIL